ncbi:MAG: hypothetical protein EOO38_13900 [Cytophagaceae bacterium]|nr:MAG: hypothetical protein EOO38_13900 [Cytophagaceae bacterium]
MLNSIQADIREMLDLAKRIENFDATLAAANVAGQPIEPTPDSYDTRKHHERRLIELRSKWDV